MSREVAGGTDADRPVPAGADPDANAHELPGAVLFACTMNTVRSVMAAAILRHLAGQRTYVRSAGVKAGEPDPFVTAVMDEIGIDVSQHNPQTLRELHDTSFDLIVTLSPEAHHQALELTRTMAVDVEYWPTLDATVMLGHGNRERVLEYYRGVRDTLFDRIKTRFGFEGGPTV